MYRVWLVSALTSFRVVTSKCIIGFQATDSHRWQSSRFYSWRWIFSSVNYNNVCGWWITTQYLRQIKENSKRNNGGFNKWLEIFAGKDLQTKLRKSENVDFKWNSAREMTQHTYIHFILLCFEVKVQSHARG